MKNQIKNLNTALYCVLFGALIGAIAGSLGVGVVFATVLYWCVKMNPLPKGAFGNATTETKEKTAEELAAEATEKLVVKMREWQEAIKGKADSAALEAIKQEVAELRLEKENAVITAMKAQIAEQDEKLIKQGETITKLKSNPPSPAGFKTIDEALLAALMEKKDALDAYVKAEGKAPGIEVKVAIDMGEGNTIGSGSTQVTLTQNTGIISTLRKRELTYMAAVSVGSIGTERALWIEETDEQGAPIFIGEGDAKTQLSVKYVEKTESVKKIAVYGKITTELIADLPQLVSYIKNNLMKRLDIKVEDALLTATGAGDDIKGMESYATAFSAGALATSIDDANELDVIEAIALQVKVAFGITKALFIHPATMAKIKLIKDDAGRPVWKDYVTTDGFMTISGLKIIETTAIDAGEFLGGDTSVAQVLIREALNIQIGLDGNDFTTNKKTLLIEKRLVQFVSANDTQVLVKGDFTTAKAALETP